MIAEDPMTFSSLTPLPLTLIILAFRCKRLFWYYNFVYYYYFPVALY